MDPALEQTTGEKCGLAIISVRPELLLELSSVRVPLCARTRIDDGRAAFTPLPHFAGQRSPHHKFTGRGFSVSVEDTEAEARFVIAPGSLKRICTP